MLACMELEKCHVPNWVILMALHCDTWWCDLADSGLSTMELEVALGRDTVLCV